MVVIVPKALHRILIKEAKRNGKPLVFVTRTLLSEWARQHRDYEPIEVLDGRTKEARDSLFKL